MGKTKLKTKIPWSWHQLPGGNQQLIFPPCTHCLLKQPRKHRASGQSETAHLLYATLQAWQTLMADFTEGISGTELGGCNSCCWGVGQLSRWVSFKKRTSDIVPLKQCLPKWPSATVSAAWTVLLRSGSACKAQQRFHRGSKTRHKKDFLVSVPFFLGQRGFKYLVNPRSQRQVSVSVLPSCAWKPLFG